MPYKDRKTQLGAQVSHYERNKEVWRQRLNDRRRKNAEWLEQHKATLRCSTPTCPESHPACITFHHPDPSAKEIGVSDAVHNWSLKRLQAEVQKCVPLCANCHLKLHWAERKQCQGTRS